MRHPKTGRNATARSVYDTRYAAWLDEVMAMADEIEGEWWRYERTTDNGQYQRSLDGWHWFNYDAKNNGSPIEPSPRVTQATLEAPARWSPGQYFEEFFKME